jgi:hypothetical protein
MLMNGGSIELLVIGHNLHEMTERVVLSAPVALDG